jgi:hypothetical protein
MTMVLKWVKQKDSMNTYRAETARYRFIMVAPPRTRAALWVQPVESAWGTDPIAERLCRTRRGAQRIAQRFEDQPQTPRRLR